MKIRETSTACVAGATAVTLGTGWLGLFGFTPVDAGVGGKLVAQPECKLKPTAKHTETRTKNVTGNPTNINFSMKPINISITSCFSSYCGHVQLLVQIQYCFHTSISRTVLGTDGLPRVTVPLVQFR